MAVVNQHLKRFLKKGGGKIEKGAYVLVRSLASKIRASLVGNTHNLYLKQKAKTTTNHDG